ncbi:allantoate permease [Niveomyces insectorum RCEF 264]|uniref:Allantoate permease n=1 Tax=Niveomyces insectorum RCEF 264 TaxID=1081102 RepID=A0A167U5E8_9HYPO|nr:allantoate permease [Niveomyces insectorum RCEF 264]
MAYPENKELSGSPAEADEGLHSSASSEELVVKPLKTWKGFFWDTSELPPDQRWLLFKLDGFILTFASIGYFLKYLDLNNVTNAFLSGMEEDLQMYGNQLVTSTSIFTVGYVIGQIPSNLLLTRVSPRWVIPSLEVGWGICTICTSSVKSYKALYVLRFFVGLFESGFYPGIHYMLGSFYTPQEIGKRAMIFWLAGSIGTMFSGFLQAAAYTNLDGVGGHAGWRWLFIIDGIITLPLALAGFVFYPHLPQSGKRTWWTTETERVLTVKRMQAIGRAGKEPWTRAKARRILLSWHTFNAKPPPLPGTRFTVAQINNLPLPTTGIFIVVAFGWALVSDAFRGSRWPFIHLGALLTILFTALMYKLPLYSNIHGRMVVYWFSNIGGGAGPLIFSWINEVCSDDSEKRALIIALANDLAYVVQAVAPNFIWKTTNFPAARIGYRWSLVMESLLIVITGVIQFIIWREKKQAAREREESEEISYEESNDGKKQANEAVTEIGTEVKLG